MDSDTVNCCHHHLQMDVDTAASLDQLRECNVSHNHAMLVIRNKGSMLFPIYISFGVISLSHGYFISEKLRVIKYVPTEQVPIGTLTKR